ncbi:MAG: hypothetical protein Q4C10_02080 [Clostridia bacterium]|nr:hypothetical protein [Clostridia bacterium]
MMYNANVNENRVNPAVNEKGSQIFKRYDCSKSQMVMYCVSAILMAFMGIYFLMLNAEASNNAFHVTKTLFGNYWQADGMTWALCVFAIVGCVVTTIQGAGLRKHTLLVTDEGVSGFTTGRSGMQPERFSLAWNQLLEARKRPASQLELKGTDCSYIVCVNDNRGAVDLIQRMLNEHREEPKVSSLRQY